MGEMEPAERLVELVLAGMSVDRAETQVGQPDGWGRPALVAWARAKGLGYAAAARAMGLPRNTVKAWFRRYGEEREEREEPTPPPAPGPPAPRPARGPRPNVVPLVQPAAAPPPPGPSGPSTGDDPERPDFARMSREEFLAWLVDDIGSRLHRSSVRDAGTVPQLVSQLRAARAELDTYRAELKVQRGIDMAGLSREELVARMQELAEALPDVFLEVYVAVYITRHKLQVLPRATGAA